MTKPILSDDELVEITGLRQAAAQARVLGGWHVPFQRRPDGTLVVSRVAFDATMAGNAKPAAKSANGLNWSRQA